MAYIVSYESSSTEYPRYIKTKTGVEANSAVLIKGGCGVINKKTLHTPKGVVTEVTKEELEFLKSQYLFNFKLEKGFYEIMESEQKAKSQASKKKLKDGGAQLTAQDFKDAGQTPPKVGASEVADDGSGLEESEKDE